MGLVFSITSGYVVVGFNCIFFLRLNQSGDNNNKHFENGNNFRTNNAINSRYPTLIFCLQSWKQILSNFFTDVLWWGKRVLCESKRDCYWVEILSVNNFSITEATSSEIVIIYLD